MEILIPLTNHDFKENNLTIVVDVGYILNFSNNTGLVSNDVESEGKIKSTLVFYKSILDESMMRKFTDLYLCVLNKKNLNKLLKPFLNRNLMILHLITTLIKSFTDVSFYKKSFFEEGRNYLSTVDE